MPTVDGGHLFLTFLMPVQLGEVARADGTISTPSHILREELALLPVAQQSPVTAAAGLVSPFARCTRTHFLRLFVIDQPMFNGRDPANPLVNAAMGVSPLVHQPFDVLSRPWLAMTADVDRRPNEPDEGFASWAMGLWTRSAVEMQAIFGQCVGFDAVDGPDAFVGWLERCQIETTMSFNDYWPGRPPLAGETLNGLLRLAGGIALGIVLLLWLLLSPGSPWALLPLLLAGLAAGAGVALWRLDRRGRRAFPAAPDSDLPSVLKALHVQQRFALFAESVQGTDAAVLHARFGAFLAEVRPSDLAAPTQAPGVIRSDKVALAQPELPDRSPVPRDLGPVA